MKDKQDRFSIVAQRLAHLEDMLGEAGTPVTRGLAWGAVRQSVHHLLSRQRKIKARLKNSAPCDPEVVGPILAQFVECRLALNDFIVRFTRQDQIAALRVRVADLQATTAEVRRVLSSLRAAPPSQRSTSISKPTDDPKGIGPVPPAEQPSVLLGSMPHPMPTASDDDISMREWQRWAKRVWG